MSNLSGTVFQSVTDWNQKIKSKQISCLELLELYLSQIEKYNPQLNAVVYMDIEQAKKAAIEADVMLSKGDVVGPLHGIPMTVKDAFDVNGMPSTWGVEELKDNVASVDSHVVDALTKSGAIVFGKTNVPAWLSDWQSFNPVYGTTNNPWDTTRVPGGSSGGSAAAVAAGLVACEYGSDIAGSIRGPAHFCGVFGHKSTCDIVSQKGHAPPGITVAPDIAAVGPIARSAADLELLLRATMGVEEFKKGAWQLRMPECDKASIADFRVAIINDDAHFSVDSEVGNVLSGLYDRIEKMGAKVFRDIQPDFNSPEIMKLFGEMRYAATSDGQSDAVFKDNKRREEEGSARDDSFLMRSLRGLTMSHYRWLKINQRREELRQEWNKVFAEVDIVLCPAAMTVAFPHDQEGERHERMVNVNNEMVLGADQTFWAGLSGFFHLPSTVAPAGLGRSGLPVGVQIIGQRYMDLQCIQFAKLLEQQVVGYVVPHGYT